MKGLKTLLIGLATSTAGLFLAGVAVVAVIVSQGLEGYRLYSYTPNLSSAISDRDGNLLRYVYHNEHRLWVPLEDISPDLVNATIAMEDHRFYSHFGVHLIAIARAAKSTFIDGELEGGSTLTQQYIKNAFLTPERTLTRKIKEAYLAILLERMVSKDTIVEKYLNEVAYGNVYYGVETASQFYFGKSASDVNVAEAAILASMTKAPSQISPVSDRNYLLSRQQIVLDKMHQQGYLSQEELTHAQNTDVRFTLQAPQMSAPHFTQQVIYTFAQEHGEDYLNTKGLHITTTLDSSLQSQVEDTVSSTVAEYSGYNVTNGAALVLQPQTGEVLAWVGSKNYYAEDIPGKFDVLTAHRQPGSTLKPFLYAMALENGHTAATMINDIKTTFELTEINKEYTPVNYDGRFHGPVSIRQALANSYNVPATRMLATVGLPTFITYLEKLGIDYIDSSRVGISLALGGYEIRPVDLASAYTSLANQGHLTTPRFVLSWTNHPGEEYQTKVESRSVIDSSVAYIITDILSDNQARSQAFGTNSLLYIDQETPIAVKTGTSNNKRDNWAIGYTPDFLVLSWVGNNDNAPMAQATSGLTGATPIWRTVTDAMINQVGSHWYEQPSDIVQSETNPYCNVGSSQPELYIQGTQTSQCKQVAALTEVTNQDSSSANNSGGSYQLYEERNGQNVAITQLTPSEYQLYQNNPFALIEKYSDILQADEVPTRVFVEPLAIPTQVSDNLSQLMNNQQVIQL